MHYYIITMTHNLKPIARCIVFRCVSVSSVWDSFLFLQYCRNRIQNHKFRIKWCILFSLFLLHFFACAKRTLYTVALYNVRCDYLLLYINVHILLYNMSIYKSHVSISQTDVSIHGQFAMILKVCAYGITTLHHSSSSSCIFVCTNLLNIVY